MKRTTYLQSSRNPGLYALLLGTVFQLGFLESCNDQLVEATRIIDPCGTFIASCTPGSFEANNADVGDFCVDPTCTIPGLCDLANPPLGTIRDVCP